MTFISTELGVHAVQAQGSDKGMYTEAQRARGEMVYTSACAACHGANLAGRQSFTNGVPPLAGDDFLDAWLGRTAAELFEQSRSAPPEDHGKVMPQQSADAIAYILSRSRFPAGQAELTTDASALKAITLDNSLRTPSTATVSVPTRSVQDGVYAPAQSKRGAAVYANSCAICHTDTLGGKDVIPPLVGPPFLGHWVGSTAADLVQTIQTTMPQDNPGSLSAKEYTDLVAYIFERNKFPAGSKEMDADRAALATIRIETKK
jgi:mono/diheme cytochrome c family protein